VTDTSVHEEADRDYEGFWARQAEALHWHEPWTQVLDWSDPPFAKWFVGGKLNVSYNCLDRHVEAGRGDRVAFHWRGEEGEQARRHLRGPAARHPEARQRPQDPRHRARRRRRDLPPHDPGSGRRDARVRAHRGGHNVVFGGFSPESVKERMEVSDAKALITADHARRKGKSSPVKAEVDAVMGGLESLQRIVVVRNTAKTSR
jgi:acetyl-CoA synthetase